ncbi:23S rRNA (pseudouridine(1915)-N(3))-methyltransferase RlmH [Conexibacter sp. DBS9H8]|uniref:23S rRNA (pseudouridine(1915)-N(3))-methyltransferase RlmH n=1 Tax=Conexibacter sp. DBS9H8 TaxID=2937801 RepID=UPI00200C0728|nr:23S rRNA (pseudouridine(1915)-N(3))-methyltransferase RlmH [Conexibacter sp. DBS9H8]
MQIIVVAVGKQRPPFVDDAEHYRKLLSRYARLEIVEVADDAALGRRLPERSYTSLLSLDGERLDSLAFSRFLEQRRQNGRDLCFVIGGAFGAPALPGIDHRLSLGPLTLPHQLARIVLLEQLFRAHKILAGEPYHY